MPDPWCGGQGIPWRSVETMEYLIGVLFGLVLGVSGIGGSLFSVPLLMLLQVPINEAMSVSLGAVTLSALCGVIFRHNNICWAPALVLGGLGLLSAPLGRAASVYLSELALMVGFVGLAMVAATSLWRKPVAVMPACPPVHTGSGSWLLPAGLVVGFLSGLFGIGGGMMLVPLLQRAGRYTMPQVLATALLAIAVISAAGFATGLKVHQTLDLSLLAKLSVTGVVGTLVGQRVALKLPQHCLPRVIASLLVTVSLLFLGASSGII